MVSRKMSGLLIVEHFKATLRNGHEQKVGKKYPGPDCIDAPADGSKLQIMPWPALGSATDYGPESIYPYLSAVPYISNAVVRRYPEIIHNCPDAKSPEYGTATYHQYKYVNGQVVQLN